MVVYSSNRATARRVSKTVKLRHFISTEPLFCCGDSARPCLLDRETSVLLDVVGSVYCHCFQLRNWSFSGFRQLERTLEEIEGP